MSFHKYPEFHRKLLQDKELIIPKMYVEKYWKGISNPIFLRFPNGVEQKIFWEESNGDICFKKNWKIFAKSLKHENRLTFKYMGGPYFKVKIFGGNDLEINYSNIKSIEDKEEVVEDAAKVIEVSDDDESEEDEFGDESVMSVDESEEDEFEVCEDESEVSGDDEDESDETVEQLQRTPKSKRSIHMEYCSNRKSKVKKVEKCSTSKAGNVRNNDENPFFKVTLTNSYVRCYFLNIPSEFSREHSNNFVGTAILQVGKDMPMKVNVIFEKINKRSSICRGWKLFREKYNLQVEDSCKFVMVQRRPLVFAVTIKRAIKGPNPKVLHGWRQVGGNLWTKAKYNRD